MEISKYKLIISGTLNDSITDKNIKCNNALDKVR